MTIELYLTDGTRARFVAEPERTATQELQEQVRTGRVFSQPSLVVAHDAAVQVFPGTALARIDLIVEQSSTEAATLRSGFLPDGVVQRELRGEEWKRRADEHRATGKTRRDHLGSVEGTPVTGLGWLQLLGGHTAAFEFTLPRPSEMDQRRFLQHFFSMATYPFERIGGGLAVVNPARVVASEFLPGAEPPQGSWFARPAGWERVGVPG
ncbi:MAG: hypothetical protein OHK0029_32980 [Armatimonadaceae bacterium]